MCNDMIFAKLYTNKPQQVKYIAKKRRLNSREEIAHIFVKLSRKVINP